MKRAMIAICLLAMGCSVLGSTSATSPAIVMDTRSTSLTTDSTVEIAYSPSWIDGEDGIVCLDGEYLFSDAKEGLVVWQPRTKGIHTLTYVIGERAWPFQCNVIGLTFAAPPTPIPPMPVDSDVALPISTYSAPRGGDNHALLINKKAGVSWTAAASSDWIRLWATSGDEDYLTFTVDASDSLGTRIGYIYVSGHVYTISQSGYKAEINPSNFECECDGGSQEIKISPPAGISWQAFPNVDWISVTPTEGVGVRNVKITVAPLDDVKTRNGTVTIAGNTFTVSQTGRRMKLGKYNVICDYKTHPIPIKVKALANTVWKVTPDNHGWISVLDSGSGRGSDDVTLAVSENPSYRERRGTAKIGTESFNIVQKGRTDLLFDISPNVSTASVNGANGKIAIVATPDLPWCAVSESPEWLTIKSGYCEGVGNGNVAFTASPNATLDDRVGWIKIIPDPLSGLTPQTLMVSQSQAAWGVWPPEIEVDAKGGYHSVHVAVPELVKWSFENTNDWIVISGSNERMGPDWINLTVENNDSVYSRFGVIEVAGRRTVLVRQGARSVEISYDKKVFDMNGGALTIDVRPDGDVSWTAIPSADWISIKKRDGIGKGIVECVVIPYVGDGNPRTGTITIGDKVVYITQRAYDLFIDPCGDEVEGNAGAGEFGVTADIGSIWQAISTEPWIAVISEYDSLTGNGKVHFTYTDNDTGKTRSGKIIVAGEEYTLTQRTRVTVNVMAEASRGGNISGAGVYSRGSKVILTALPDDGYQFAYWEGDISSVQNPLQITADEAKSVRAVFVPQKPEFISAISSTEGVVLKWSCLPWATEYRIYRAPSSEKSGGPLVILPADSSCTYTDQTGDVEKTYWYWIEAIGEDKMTECELPVSGARKKVIVISSITYTNLKGANHSNPATYQEGDVIAFTDPEAIPGYTFTGWNPRGVTSETTGRVEVMATWQAHSYTIVYHSNGGVGTMESQTLKYDSASKLRENTFVRNGYVFAGWGTSAASEVVYGHSEEVLNMTHEKGGCVHLYAVWMPICYLIHFEPNGGTGKMGDMILTYDSVSNLAMNVFKFMGKEFAGWASSRGGEVEYLNGGRVLNLSDKADDVITLYAVWNEVVVAAPVIELQSGVSDFVDSSEVTMTCATDGARIYFSTDGTTPRLTDAFLYLAPIVVNETVTIKAVAVKDGVKSPYVMVTFIKRTMSLGEAVGANELTFTTGGDVPWSPVVDISDGGDGYSARSGLMACPASEAVSWMEVALDGPGELSFWWKVSCENDPDACSWDRLMYFVDDENEDADRIDGIADWEQKNIEFTGLGVHKVRWVYLKDGYDEDGKTGEDCGWVDGVVWRPGVIIPSDVTGGAEFRVTSEWAAQYGQFQTRFGSDLATALTKSTGKMSMNGAPMQVWHDYVAGTDPTNPNDLFKAVLEMVDGKPVISWHPDLNKFDETRTYKVYGRRSLSNGDAWEYPANAAEHQFFKVDVSMPGAGDGGSDSPGVIEAWRFVAIPTAVSGLVYDGTTKQGLLPGTGYTLSGASAIGAGNYTAVATLASGCKWESGSQANQQIPWSIAKANNAWLSVPSMSATTFLTGSSVTVTDGVSKFGTVTRNYSNSAIQSLTAGSYTLVSTVAGTANYTGLTHSIPFTVTAPATKIALPTAKTGLVYTGSTLTGVATGTGYTLSGNTGVNAGTYTATATLKSGYAWSDGVSSQSRTISWSIAKATNSWLTQPSLSSAEFAEGSTITISLGSVKFGVRQANYTAAELAQLTAGSYTLEVSVKGTDNYTGLTKSIPFTVTAKPTVSNLYCVVDLSAGASAKSYPVEYVDAEPSEGWGDVHKTTKLVLRRVEKGSFSMLSQGKTSISKDFYVGVFEVTQKQYELVMGSNPASGYGVGDALPVYKVSYDDIRGASTGAGWPTSSAVDGESFLGKLRARTSMDFDLPTEAQWEYACRAGTTGKYYWTEAGLATSLCAWYVSNSGYVTHNVGTKRSNDWGIFDMSGNVSEWCRDWYSSALAYGNDPKGAASASYNRRVTRGGCYSSGELDLRMDDTIYRSGIDAATQSSSTGFRLVVSE